MVEDPFICTIRVHDETLTVCRRFWVTQDISRETRAQKSVAFAADPNKAFTIA